MLKKLLEQKRFPSPLILEGVDRAPAIKEVALYSLCQKETACGECRGCKQVKKGFHPDWISLQGSVKIEDLRSALSNLRQRPYEAALRLFTYDDAQEANAFVQNALLKTLEEPLALWRLVLGVNSKMSLLSTIRSRCLFFKLPEPEFKAELSEDEENIFSAIEEANELLTHTHLENVLKDRQKAKVLFQNLLKAASQKSYPNHWKNLGPHLELSISELARNLNPRIVWDHAWTQSFTEPL